MISRETFLIPGEHGPWAEIWEHSRNGIPAQHWSGTTNSDDDLRSRGLADNNHKYVTRKKAVNALMKLQVYEIAHSVLSFSLSLSLSLSSFLSLPFLKMCVYFDFFFSKWYLNQVAPRKLTQFHTDPHCLTSTMVML